MSKYKPFLKSTADLAAREDLNTRKPERRAKSKDSKVKGSNIRKTGRYLVKEISLTTSFTKRFPNYSNVPKRVK